MPQQPMRCLALITDFEWKELKERFGDYVFENPDVASVIVDIVRQERRH